jgi:hypothetical protein
MLNIVEEVVDFEDWMADAKNPTGKIFRFSGCDLADKSTLEFQLHPEVGTVQ